MSVLLTCLVLCLPAVLPALALSGLTPTTLFLVPLVGAAMAGVAAILEFGITGSISGWFAGIAVAANALAAFGIAARLSGRRAAHRKLAPGAISADPEGTAPSSPSWRVICALVLLAAVAWPLVVLRAPIMGYDTQAIWLTHTALIWVGHTRLVDGLTRPPTSPPNVYSNPDYPPLVPAAGAMAYAAIGGVNERLAVGVTVLLNAAAVGLVGTGLLLTVRGRHRGAPAFALLVAFAFCGAAFGIAGMQAVNGYADLLWAAAALGATIYGLVLPRRLGFAGVAWLCILVASLTKNEGFLVSIVISVLIAVRYIDWDAAGAGMSGRLDHLIRTLGHLGLAGWSRLVAMALGPLVPGMAWIVLMRQKGVQDAFFATDSGESLHARASATTAAMAAHLYLFPAAALVLVLGTLTLRWRRRGLGLANDGWLWTVAVAAFLVIFATYVFGSLAIHWWLTTSVNRTTIFDQMTFLADMTVWSLVVLAPRVGASPQRTPPQLLAEADGPAPATSPAPSPVPADQPV